MVVQSLSRAVTTKANAAFLSNAANPTGLLNDGGIFDGGTITTNLDPIVDAVSDIESTGGTATHIIASPASWAFISKIKTETASAQSLLGAGTSATQRQLLGLPVLVTPAMPDGDLLVLDKNAVIAAQSPATPLRPAARTCSSKRHDRNPRDVASGMGVDASSPCRQVDHLAS